jgi:hypothetical protein
MRFVGRPALLVGVLVLGYGAATAQDGTQEQRQACTPDAMRLCSDAIPDVEKITKCMISKYKELSEPCRLAMRHGPNRRAYRHHRPSYERASN